MSVAILVPVLGRPGNVAPLAQAFADTTPAHRILWICDPDDRDEQDAIAKIGGQMISPGGTYATKIWAGVEATDEPLVALVADDVLPHAGWLQAALEAIDAGAQVVGLNDLRPRGEPENATHFLVTRAYCAQPTIDGGPGPMHTGYGHCFVDRELVETARFRGVYAYAPDAIVEHRHHLEKVVEYDPTYAKGDATFRVDSRLFRRRRRLWAK